MNEAIGFLDSDVTYLLVLNIQSLERLIGTLPRKLTRYELVFVAVYVCV